MAPLRAPEPEVHETGFGQTASQRTCQKLADPRDIGKLGLADGEVANGETRRRARQCWPITRFINLLLSRDGEKEKTATIRPYCKLLFRHKGHQKSPGAAWQG